MDDDDNEREYHEKLLAEMQRRIKEQTDGIMGQMMEQMAPMLMGTQLLADESKAWDDHAKSYVGAVHMPEGFGLPENVVELAVQHADAMLAERRKRFNETLYAERMRGIMPSTRGLCNEPVLRLDGTDTGMRCTRNAGHDGKTHF